MDEKEMTMREALNLALDQALEADERVFLLGEDIADPGASGPTAGLSTKYGHDRVLDTPISEAAILGAAVGAATALTASGLFKGQSQEFFAAVTSLAQAADAAQRQ